MDISFSFLNGQANKNVNGQRFRVCEREAFSPRDSILKCHAKSQKIGPAIALLYPTSSFKDYRI